MTADIYMCAISTCDWQHPATPPESMRAEWRPGNWETALSQFFFEKLRAAASIDDDAIRTHLETHSVLDWLTEITALRKRTKQAEAAFNSAMEALRMASDFADGMRRLRESAGTAQSDISSIKAGLPATAADIQEASEGND